MTKHPECDKMCGVKDQSQVVGEFIDWLAEKKGIILAEWGDGELSRDELYRTHSSTERLLAEFFDIDLAKIETEKRAMLDAIRSTAPMSKGRVK